MGENENGFTQGITPDDIFLVRPTGWWVASYHGKYSTKRRSHILICDCVKTFLILLTQNIEIYGGVRSTGGVPKQVRACM